MKAIWNNTVIAESEEVIEIEGSYYFPPASVNQEYLQASDRISYCPWKGRAHYYSLVVGGEINRNAVWSYASPKTYARAVTGYMAFWNGVELVD